MKSDLAAKARSLLIQVEAILNRIEDALTEGSDPEPLCKVWLGSAEGAGLAKDIKEDILHVWARGTLRKRWRDRKR